MRYKQLITNNQQQLVLLSWPKLSETTLLLLNNLPIVYNPASEYALDAVGKGTANGIGFTYNLRRIHGIFSIPIVVNVLITICLIILKVGFFLLVAKSSRIVSSNLQFCS